MKTVKDYEEEFDDKFEEWNFKISNQYNREVKDYIFQELLPQVLSEIINIEDLTTDGETLPTLEYFKGFMKGQSHKRHRIKLKAKEMGIKI